VHYTSHNKCQQTLKTKLKCVLSCFLKTTESVTARRSADSAFYTAGPACEKASFPRLMRNRGSKKSDVDENSSRMTECMRQQSFNAPASGQATNAAEEGWPVICSRVPNSKTKRAAAFCTACSGATKGRPSYSSELQ